MKALPSIAFSEFKGTAGDVTARRTGGRTVLNGRAQHSHIKTQKQCVRRASFGYITRQFKQLTAVQQKAWQKLAEASVGKLAWDYYDACDRYRSVKVSQNWKLREEKEKKFEKEIEDFGVPVAVFYSKRLKNLSDARKFVEENADGLKAGYNPEFYRKDYRTGGRDCSEVLCRMIGNDYEYALWSIYFADKSTIKELGQKYSTELRLLNEAEMLQARYDEIHWDKGAEQEDCLKLREDCRRFISAAGKLSGEHRAFGLSLKTPQFIIDNLEEQSLSCRIEDGTLIIQARNL